MSNNNQQAGLNITPSSLFTPITKNLPQLSQNKQTGLHHKKNEINQSNLNENKQNKQQSDSQRQNERGDKQQQKQSQSNSNVSTPRKQEAQHIINILTGGGGVDEQDQIRHYQQLSRRIEPVRQFSQKRLDSDGLMINTIEAQPQLLSLFSPANQSIDDNHNHISNDNSKNIKKNKPQNKQDKQKISHINISNGEVSISPRQKKQDRFGRKNRLSSGPQLPQKSGTQSLSSGEEDGEIEDDDSDKTLRQRSPNIQDYQILMQANHQAKIEAISEVFQSSLEYAHNSGSQDDLQMESNNLKQTITTEVNQYISSHRPPLMQKINGHSQKESVISIKLSPVQNPNILQVINGSPSLIEESQNIKILIVEDTSDKNLNISNTDGDEYSHVAPKQTLYKSNQSKVSVDHTTTMVYHNKIHSMIFQSPIQQYQGNEEDVVSQNEKLRKSEISPDQQMLLKYQNGHQRQMSQQLSSQRDRIENAQSVNDTYQDEDSLIMTERNEQDQDILQISRQHQKSPDTKKIINQSTKVAKPKIYEIKNQQQYKQLMGVKNQDQPTITEDGPVSERAVNLMSKPQKIQMITAQNGQPQQLRIRNKAVLPQKKNMDFQTQHLPEEDGYDNQMIFQEQTQSKDESLIYIKGRDNSNFLDLAASSVCWEPNQILVEGEGYTIGTKSIPFSATHKNEMDYNQNFFDDGGETFKFSILQQTPKQYQISDVKQLIQQINGSLPKSSMGLETQPRQDNFHVNNQQNDFDNFNTKDFPTIGNDEDFGTEGAGIKGNGIRSSGAERALNTNVSKFYNTQYTMIQNDTNKRQQLAFLEAKAYGRKVRADLEYYHLRKDKSNQSYQIPEGLIIIDEEGPLQLQDSDLQHLSGLGGSKLLVGNQNTIIIKNHQSDFIRISALQFELLQQLKQNKYDTPTKNNQTTSGLENLLFHIVQEEESRHPDFKQIKRTQSILFEDCAFINDQSQYDNEQRLQFFHNTSQSCLIAMKIQNFSAYVNLDITFQNCAFLGFHHSIVCNSPNVSISALNCMFKKTLFESIVCIDLQYLKLSQTIFKKCCSSDSYRAAVSLIHNQEKNILQVQQLLNTDNEPKQVDISGCTFRKCFGLGLQVVGQEKETQKLQIKVKDCKFQMCQGQAGIKIENVQSQAYNRFEYRESNLNSQHTYKIEKKLQSEKKLKQDLMIRIIDCDMTQCKRNGLELNNVFGSFQIKRCNFKENKDSGIYLNQQKQDSETVVCGCVFKQTLINQSTLHQSTNEKQLLSNRPSLQPSPDKSIKYQNMQNQNKAVVVKSKIEDCMIQMNQMHGMEIIGYKQDDLIIKDCQIQDNFCDGINLQAEITEEAQESHQPPNYADNQVFNGQEIIITQQNPQQIDPLHPNSLSGFNEFQNNIVQDKDDSQNRLISPKIEFITNKIASNKNCGVNFSTILPQQVSYYFYANEFKNNLNTDLLISEEQPYHRIKLLKYKKQQTNKFEQQIQKNFEIDHLRNGINQSDNSQDGRANTDQQDQDDLKYLEMTVQDEDLYQQLYGYSKNANNTQRNLKSISALERNQNGRIKGIAVVGSDSYSTDQQNEEKLRKKRKISVSSCIGRLCQPCGNIKSKRYQNQNNSNANTTSKSGISGHDTTAHSKVAQNIQLGRQAAQNSFERPKSQISNWNQYQNQTSNRQNLYRVENSYNLDNAASNYYQNGNGEAKQNKQSIESEQDIGDRGSRNFKNQNQIIGIGNKDQLNKSQYSEIQSNVSHNIQTQTQNLQLASLDHEQILQKANSKAILMQQQQEQQIRRSQQEKRQNINGVNFFDMNNLRRLDSSSRNTNISLFKDQYYQSNIKESQIEQNNYIAQENTPNLLTSQVKYQSPNHDTPLVAEMKQVGLNSFDRPLLKLKDQKLNSQEKEQQDFNDIRRMHSDMSETSKNFQNSNRSRFKNSDKKKLMVSQSEQQNGKAKDDLLQKSNNKNCSIF